MRVYEGVPSCEEPHKLRGSMKGRQNCMGARAWKTRLRISHNEMMSIYIPLLSPFPFTLYLHTLPTRPHIAQLIFVLTLSPHAPCLLPSAKLNGGGGKQILLQLWPLSASVSFLNRCLQWLLQLRSNTICSQTDRIFIYSETYKDNACHSMI